VGIYYELPDDRNMKLSRLFFLFTFFLLQILVPLAAQQQKTVHVGWYSAAELQTGSTPETLGGYNYEYLCKIAQYTGWKYEFVFGTWKDLENQLIGGTVDIIGDVAITPLRRQKYSFCKYPNGVSRMLVGCRPGDERFAYDDYKSFDGMTVATIPSEFCRTLLDREAEQYHFSVRYAEYPTYEKMFAALDSGAADAAVFNDITRYGNYKIISQSDPNPYYFIVNKDRPDLLTALNSALHQIQANSRFLPERLFERYFGENGKDAAAAFTRDELQYIRTKQQITVLFCTSFFPISYMNNGTPDGYIADYLQLLQKKTMLKFRYKLFDSYEAAAAAFMDGKGEVLPYAADDSRTALKLHANITQPYLDLQDGYVYTRGMQKTLQRVAVQDNMFSAAETVCNHELHCYHSTTACLNAVMSGAVDAALLSRYDFEQQSYHARYRTLSFHPAAEINAGITLGVRKSDGELLYSILEKAAGSISETTRNTLLLDSVLVKPRYTFIDFVVNNAVFILVFITAGFMLVAVLFIQGYKSRQSKKSAELLRAANETLITKNQELAEAYLQKEAAESKASRANEIKNSFLSRMSHDMRTPLNAILGLAGFGIEESSKGAGGKIGTYFAQIEDSGKFLLSLVNDVLDVQHLENGDIKLEKNPVNLGDMIDKVTALVWARAGQKDITVTMDGAEQIRAFTVNADEKRLEQLFMNILTNAVKYTPPGGHIVWNFSKPEEADAKIMFVTEIRDDGVGISKKFQRTMYDTFTREYNSQTGTEEGTGIGLSIVKKIVELYDGQIDCKSELGQGTAFTVRLPLDVAGQTKPVKDGQLQNRESGTFDFTGKRVLLCEDNELNTMIAVQMLESRNISVDTAENGAEGVGKIRAVLNNDLPRYDCILMDVRMPVMDGLAAAAEIRKFDTTVPIVALSANAYREDIQKSLKAGMNAHLSKPIDKTALFATLAQLMQ
jgi:signal transduction histidine kinase/ActR/RegA family two-component response regulator